MATAVNNGDIQELLNSLNQLTQKSRKYGSANNQSSTSAEI
jgi:hypothetical protein